MPRISPTLEGFRAAFRRPSFTLAEVTWRWTVWATAILLLFYGVFEYLNTLPVTKGELFFLRTRHPYLVSRALAHIFRGSMTRAAIALIVAWLLISLLWIIAASLGRLGTVRAMLDYFRERTAFLIGPAIETREDDPLQRQVDWRPALSSLLRVNFLRAAAALAGLAGLAGAAILASMVSSDIHPRPGLAFALFLSVAALVGFCWCVLNWVLSLAALFVVRDGADSMGAIASAVGFCRDRFGAVTSVSTWTGFAHVAAFFTASTIVSVPLGFIPLVPWRLVMFSMLVVTLLYFALADWIYTARLAGYVCILETPEALLAPPPPPPPVFSAPPVLTTTIDRDELILSDIPSPAIG